MFMSISQSFDISASYNPMSSYFSFFMKFFSHFFLLKKEFIGPGLHLRSVHADHARLPLQWTLNYVFSVYGNNNRRIRPPPDRGILKIISRLLMA